MESNQFYVYLSSDDSKIYFPDNKAAHFTIKLPEILHLRGKWQLALCDIQYPSIEKKKPEQLLLLADICQDSIIGDTRSPVLRRFKYRTRGYTDFNVLYYVSLKNREVDRISVYLRTDSGEEPSFVSGTVKCTLHFQHVE